MKNSKIEWTHHTFNPWRGCTKVSAGCANCYAETLSGRNPALLGTWGPQGTRVIAAPAMWNEPLKWNRDAEVKGVRERVFCVSLCDVFENWEKRMSHVPKAEYDPSTDGKPPVSMCDVRGRLWKLIDATPALDWLLLTKRPENVMWMVPDVWRQGFPENVWMGTSVENQEMAGKRIHHLLDIPAKVHFLSCEPLLGPVDLTHVEPIDSNVPCSTNTLTGITFWPDNDQDEGPKIDWVIAGGESGRGARRMLPVWAQRLRNQCDGHGVPFLFKQWGDHDETGRRVGKKAAGRLLSGELHDEYPLAMV